MAATSSSSGPRYAPEDPTLPKPWKGLIDGSTEYMYFWNPETNVTQYERPVSSQPPVLPPPPPLLSNPPKSATVALNSSVQVQQLLGGPGHGQHHDSNEEGRQRNGSRSHQYQGSRSTSAHSQSYANGSACVGHGASNAYNLGHSGQGSRSSARGHGSLDAGGGSSAELYRRQHEITVTGDDVPPPLTAFESTGFPSEILKEVRYLLQGGANVVRCAALCRPHCGALI